MIILKRCLSFQAVSLSLLVISESIKPNIMWAIFLYLRLRNREKFDKMFT